MVLVWDEPHLKALLRISRYPFNLIAHPPWYSWIAARGGLSAVYNYLRTCTLPEELHRLLETILAHPYAQAELYADKLFISRRTYFRQLDELVQALLPHINAWVIPSSGRRYFNVPVPLTPMIGADKAVETISALLLRPEVRLATLIGPGGIGKTRLAIEVAWRIKECFEAGVCFVSLSSVEDERLLVIQIAHSLGVETAGSQPLLELLKVTLRELQLLLILDNFEQLIQAGPLVTELLEAAPYLKVLVTSREMLNVYGEHLFEVPLLPLPELKRPLPVEQVRQSPAVRLFVERAQALDQNFALTEENASIIAEICHRLDGLPLALELAAAQVHLLGLSQIHSQLRHPLTLLQGGPRDKPARHQALRDTIA
ncbi:MAG: AAA family ATPase, partial [Anaerolineae bacterium]|nr:AAA family ATPase [Anaerolineae bacterium]